jgi:hypothetical protein
VVCFFKDYVKKLQLSVFLYDILIVFFKLKMEKQTYEFHCAEKQSQNTKVDYTTLNMKNDFMSTDLSSKVMHDEKNHFRTDATAIITCPTNTADGQFGSNGTFLITISKCNPSDIIPRLITAYKRWVKWVIFLLSIITIVAIMTSGICFVLTIQHDRSLLNKIEIMIFGSLTTVSSVTLLVILHSLFYTVSDGYNWINNALQIVQLDGKTWQYQIDSLHETVPKSLISSCDWSIYCRFKVRPNGHLILTKEGLVIDEMIAFRYDKFIIIGVDLINNAMQTRWIIRVGFVTYEIAESQLDKDGYTKFYVDLFMPSYIQIQDVVDIRETILSNSLKYLLVSQYYANSQTNSH